MKRPRNVLFFKFIFFSHVQKKNLLPLLLAFIKLLRADADRPLLYLFRSQDKSAEPRAHKMLPLPSCKLRHERGKEKKNNKKLSFFQFCHLFFKRVQAFDFSSSS